MVIQIVFLIIGIGLGVLIGFFAFRRKEDNSMQLILDEKAKAADAVADTLRRDAQVQKEELSQERSKSESLQIRLATLQTENSNLIERLSEQKTQLEDLQTQFKKEFENLANQILEDKSKRFSEQNETQLKNILDPLKDRIRDFEKRVNETHNESAIGRSALQEQLRHLAEMNKKMSEDAINLTTALKGDRKIQGNWGEHILEKILERSGLTKGRDYDVQQSFTMEDGSRLQPDVIIRLPENRNLIVDSKVSLVAYNRYYASFNTDDKAVQEAHLKDHINSIRAHIKGLSGKNYQNLSGIGSPDFVLLFIPIEPAFMLAISADNELYNEAFDKKVVLVSPTTLLVTLLTIDLVWKQEYQSQNAMEIAKQGADMYDKFVGFVEDMIKVGKHMEESKKTYAEAMNKLHEGKGNLVRRAENMKKLGIKAGKQLPQGLVDRAEDQ